MKLFAKIFNWIIKWAKKKQPPVTVEISLTILNIHKD